MPTETVTSVELEQLVEKVTRRVMNLLHQSSGSRRAPSVDHLRLGTPAVVEACEDCRGLCVQKCASRVGRVVDAGADRLSASLGATNVAADLASIIDHTLLRPDATEAEIVQLCEEARRYRFAAVCVNPNWVPLCTRLLRGSGVRVATVVGFPLGAHTTESKVFETRKALREGAHEIDMVINIGALKSKDHAAVERDIRSVVEACHEVGATAKVIIEAALLTDEEKVVASALAKAAGADYVKTSTGFGPGGATESDVALIRSVVGPGVGIKAAGGIRTAEEALGLVQAGATRIGASAGVRIVQEAESRRSRAAMPLSTSRITSTMLQRPAVSTRF